MPASVHRRGMGAKGRERGGRAESDALDELELMAHN